MISYLDPTLFPDEILVVELTPNRYVYPIYKNGSSSLFETAIGPIGIDRIAKLEQVEVFLRDPFERYVSGVQTYLMLNPHLARDTALAMIDEYLFLNRHFTLQFHWLMNLQRFNPNIKLILRPMSELNDATTLTWNTLTRDQQLIDFFKNNQKLWFYLQLDKILTEEFIGKTVRFSNIVQQIKEQYPLLYKETIERVRNLCTALE
jgi:hypothetical protein